MPGDTSTQPSRPPLVLVANDQDWFARSLESTLAPDGCAVVRARSGQQALALARALSPDAIIVDSHLPAMDGMDLCALLRDDPAVSPATPIVVTTSDVPSRGERIRALRAGAWALFGQPLDAELLLAQLHAFLRARHALERARAEAAVDPETGLYNARAIALRAREACAAARRQGLAMAVVVVAVDPAQGEDADDTIARAVTHALAAGERPLRGADVVGRIGFREFAVVAVGCDADGARRIADRLRVAVECRVQRPVLVHVGTAAVPDAAEAPHEALELLYKASRAARLGRAALESHSIVAMDGLPVTSS